MQAANALLAALGAPLALEAPLLCPTAAQLSTPPCRGTLVLAAEHQSLREALDAITASPLQVRRTWAPRQAPACMPASPDIVPASLLALCCRPGCAALLPRS